MSQIKTKLGFIVILLLSVVMIVPSASSKYIKHYRSIIRLESEVASYNLWWNYGHGSTVSASNMGVADATASSSIGSDGIITINSTTVPTLKSAGYYMLIAKGGNGGRGVDKTTGTYTSNATCGYGGVVCGIYYLDPATTTLKVCLGNNGADAITSYSSAAVASSFGRSAFKWVGQEDTTFYPGDGGTGGGISALGMSGGGGGGTTWVFANSTDILSPLMIAGGGGASGSSTDGATGMGAGGGAGSNVLWGGTTAAASSKLSGTVYAGLSGAGAFNPTGGSNSGGGDNGGGQGIAGKGYTTTGWVCPGLGGNAAQSDKYVGGGGGGGYAGGGGGDTGGGGGGASFISSSIDTSSTLVNKASYITTMEDVFNIYFPGEFEYDDDTGMFYDKQGELERYSFFVLYYISASSPTSL